MAKQGLAEFALGGREAEYSARVVFDHEAREAAAKDADTIEDNQGFVGQWRRRVIGSAQLHPIAPWFSPTCPRWSKR